MTINVENNISMAGQLNRLLSEIHAARVHTVLKNDRHESLAIKVIFCVSGNVQTNAIIQSRRLEIFVLHAEHIDARVGQKLLCLNDLIWFAIQIVERFLILVDRTVFDWVENGHMLTFLVPNTREGDGAPAGWVL